MDIIEESYYGKLPEFQEMETLFDKIIEKANKEGLKKCNPNKYAEHKKIEKIFCKLFGFKRTSIYWEPYSLANAFTYSLNAFIVFSDKKKYVTKTNKGFYDNSHSTFLQIFISTGLIDEGLTAREIIAIILHETGHNFDYSNYHKFDVIIHSILNPIIPIEIGKNKNQTDDLREQLGDKIKEKDDNVYMHQRKRDRINRKVIENIKWSLKVNSVLNFILLPINAVTDIAYFIFAPFSNITQLAGKKGELFADSFATAYGYGTELITSLKKLQDTTKLYNPKSKINRFFMDLSKLQGEILISLCDVHGTDQERCQECIEKLKFDLKHNEFPPEVKEELVNEINDMTQLYKSFMKFDKDEKYKITKIMRTVCGILFRGKPNIQKLFKRNKV